MARRSLTLVLLLNAAIAGACGGSSGGDAVVGVTPAPQKPTAPIPVLSRLEVTPDNSLLIQGDAQQLAIKAFDQFGTRLLDATGNDWVSQATYVSSAPAIARVSKDGLVTALNPGVATITASLKLADSTRAASVVASVEAPTATFAMLTMFQDRHWSPYTVTLKAPATVTWVVPSGAPTIWLNVWDNAEKMEFVDGVTTRTFSTPGYYYYGTGGGLMWNEEGGVVRVF